MFKSSFVPKSQKAQEPLLYLMINKEMTPRPFLLILKSLAFESEKTYIKKQMLDVSIDAQHLFFYINYFLAFAFFFGLASFIIVFQCFLTSDTAISKSFGSTFLILEYLAETVSIIL